mmetsp:Transcript_10760/g.16029  ORF Transcript_10760/g.16029 Transcript_10760/m.16029 type:complete len:429 (+) Transcript_10760:108-1394(+)
MSCTICGCNFSAQASIFLLACIGVAALLVLEVVEIQGDALSVAKGIGIHSFAKVNCIECPHQETIHENNSVAKVREWYDDEPPVKEYLPTGFAYNNKDKMTLDALQMCTSAKGGPQNRALVCEKDPTCRACVDKSDLLRADAVIKAFYDEELAEKRRDQLKFWFRNASDIVLIATDSHFRRFAENFLCGCEARNLDPNVLIMATDEATEKYFRNKGVYVVGPSFYGVSLPLVNAFIDTMVAITAASAELIGMGYNVVIQDADVVWMRDPRWMLKHPRLHLLDLQFQLAPRWDAQGVANTGFILARATQRTGVFLRSLLEITSLYYWKRDDQVVWNSLLRHYHFGMLHWTTLPRTLKINGTENARFLDLHTSNGKDGTASWIGNKTVILHTVARGKKMKFEVTGNWFLKEFHGNITCISLEEAKRKMKS